MPRPPRRLRCATSLAFALALAGTPVLAQIQPAPAPTPTSSITSSQIDENGVWEELSPPGRQGHAGVYDPTRRRVFVFGDGNPAVWSFPIDDPGAWARLDLSGPGPADVNGQEAVYDPIADRIIVFAGDESGTVFQLPLSGTPAWSVLAAQGDPPWPRSGHSLVFDSLHNRVILFGGGTEYYWEGDVWILDLNATPTWSPLVPFGPAPPMKFGQAAIYDPVRDRMIVFGGELESASTNDCWVVPLTPLTSPGWSRLSPAGTMPAPRRGAAAAYDPDGDRMLIFGGRQTYRPGIFEEHGDLIALSLSGTPTWTTLLADGTGPSGRHGSILAYDAVQKRAVVFAGIEGDLYDLDTGIHQFLETWVARLDEDPVWQLAGVTPRGRSRCSLTYDSNRNRALLFGGYASTPRKLYYEPCGALFFGETYTYSGRVWDPSVLSDGPTRANHTAIFDAARDRLIVYAGGDAIDLFGDVWSLSFSGVPTWQQIATLGDGPPPRRNHSAVVDPTLDRMLVFGGLDRSGPRDDLWALSLGQDPQWSEIHPAGEAPPARYGHAAVYDPLRRRMVVYGGTGAAGVLGDVWALELNDAPVWVRLDPAGTPPAREDPLAVYDPDRDRMLVTHGDAGVTALEFEPSPAWHTLAPAGRGPTLLRGRRMVYDPPRRRVLVACGTGFFCDSYYDLWALNLGRPRRARPIPPVGEAVVEVAVPSPLRDGAHLSIELDEPSHIRIAVYGVDGRIVAVLSQGSFDAGRHEVAWDGHDRSGRRLPPGIYWVRTEVGGRRVDRKVVCLR